MKQKELVALAAYINACVNKWSSEMMTTYKVLSDMCEPSMPPPIPRALPLAVGAIVKLSHSLASLEPKLQFPMVPIGTRGEVISFTDAISGAWPIVHFTGIAGTRAVPPSWLEFIGYEAAPTKTEVPTTSTTQVLQYPHGPSTRLAPAYDEAGVELKKLLDYFNSPSGYERFGYNGDEDNCTPAETAIRAMRTLAGLKADYKDRSDRIMAYETLLTQILRGINGTLESVENGRKFTAPIGIDYRGLKIEIEKALK